MSDLEHVHRAERDAEKRYSEAMAAVYHELMEKGVGGAEFAEQIEKRVKSLRDDYNQKRFERMVEERDVNMLRRGTKRGMLIVGGIVGLLLSIWVLNEAFTANFDGSFAVLEEGLDPADVRTNYILVGVVLVVCAGASLHAAWRLGRVPLLGKENE